MNAAELTRALNGRWHGSYGSARCPSHDDHRPSLSLQDGDGRVLWNCHAGCSQDAVWDALRRLGHLEERSSSRSPSFTTNHSSATNCSTLYNGVLDDEHCESSYKAYALEIWRASKPAAGTTVESYLRGRGITLPVPLSLRFHPNLKHGTTGLFFEAMVAGVQAADRRITGVHRTFLLPGGRGKARVGEPKMALGTLGNGAVRLGPPRAAMGIAEGLESAMSAMQLFDIPVWCALGSRFNAVALDDHVSEVQVFTDNGEAGEKAAYKAMEHYTRLGKQVFIRRPPEGFDDWNSALPHWHGRPAQDWEY